MAQGDNSKRVDMGDLHDPDHMCGVSHSFKVSRVADSVILNCTRKLKHAGTHYDSKHDCWFGPLLGGQWLKIPRTSGMSTYAVNDRVQSSHGPAPSTKKVSRGAKKKH